MNSSRRLYQAQEMERLLRPGSIALIGASANPASLGGRTLGNLQRFAGRLHLVNPHHPEILGRPCHACIAAVPEAVDCAVLAIPQAQVEAMVEQCAAAGVGAVVVLASGYAETDTAEGTSAQERLADIARRADMRLVGPNCVGAASFARGMHAAFAEFPSAPEVPGARIGLVSQSGALGLSLSQAAERGVSFSHVFTCGNSADVDVADFVAFLAEDPACDAIALTFEGLPAPQRLIEAAGEASKRSKPLVFCQVGVSAVGQAAVRFHTATTPSTPELAMQLKCLPGVVGVQAIETLVETAVFFAKAQAAAAPGVAVLTGSGGTGILAMDAAVRAGVPAPMPAAQTQRRLREALPAFASARNPCDATAQATRNPDSVLAAAQALLADEAFGTLVLPWGRSQTPTLLSDIGALGRHHRKPVCVVWMSQAIALDTLQQIERDPSLCLFHSLDACMQAIAMRTAASSPF